MSGAPTAAQSSRAHILSGPSAGSSSTNKAAATRSRAAATVIAAQSELAEAITAATSSGWLALKPAPSTRSISWQASSRRLIGYLPIAAALRAFC